MVISQWVVGWIHALTVVVANSNNELGCLLKEDMLRKLKHGGRVLSSHQAENLSPNIFLCILVSSLSQFHSYVMFFVVSLNVK